MSGSGRDPRDLLEEMIEELAFLDDLLQDVDRSAFLERKDLQRVAERSLEILGEASKGLPEKVRQDHDHVPWSEMAQMRDLLIHAYHRVEPRIVWQTAQDDALPLRPSLESVLEEEEDRWGDQGKTSGN